MKKIINPWTEKEGYDCFACSPSNPVGLHMEFYEDGDDIVGIWHPSKHYQGWLETMHGGILCTLMDETAGWVVTRKMQTTGMTSKLEGKFRKAVPTDEETLTVRAHLTDCHRNIAFISMTLENAQGETCVEGEAAYFTFNKETARNMGFERCEVENENEKKDDGSATFA